jgi:hypothetical protein
VVWAAAAAVWVAAAQLQHLLVAAAAWHQLQPAVWHQHLLVAAVAWHQLQHQPVVAAWVVAAAVAVVVVAVVAAAGNCHADHY